MAVNDKNIGEMIRERRLKKGYTQKALAALIHVSPQAIAKWELGQSMPDINLLLPLSRVLEIGVDELLGGDRRKEFDKKYQKSVSLGEEIALLVCEDALKEFPNDQTFLYRRACNEFFIGTAKGISQAERNIYLERAIGHFAKLHEKYPENVGYISFLARTYFARGMRDAAIAVAYTCPNRKDTMDLLDILTEGEENLIRQQRAIERRLFDLYNSLLTYNTRDSINAAYSLVDSMLGEDKFLRNTLLWELYTSEACLSLNEGNTEDFAAKLTMAYEAAVAYDNLPKEVIPYRSPLFDRLCNDRNRGSIFFGDFYMFLSRLLSEPEFSQPAAKQLKERIVEERFSFRPLHPHEWAQYYQFCRQYICKGNFLNFGTRWDMTEEELDAMVETLKNNTRYPDNGNAYLMELNREYVERLVGRGIMTGCVAYYRDVENIIMGYCNCGNKEKYKFIGISEKERAVPTAPEGAKILSITEILTADKFKNCGIEEKLLAYTLDQGKEKGYTYAEVYPLERMAFEKSDFEFMLTLYKKVGFTVVRDLSNEFDGRYYIMQKEL